MCGIAGAASIEREDRTLQGLVKSMCDLIVHRGPDDEGYYSSGLAVLGIRRLSIIDLQTGHQPILNEDGTCAVVLNGEIYNYRELRQKLMQNGHRLSTQGDTETIVHLYEDYGVECVKHLRGMFCFALWDEKRQRLLLARDRIGIKQLYYTEQDGRLVFGSEIKCILQVPGLKRRVDPRSLSSYLTFLYVPAPATMYVGISELPPAHFLTWERGKIQIQRYWRLEYRPDHGHREEYYIEGLADRLTDAVRSHLVSDVPLGAFLSGGIDSGLMVALMANVLGRPVETFTAGFQGDYGFYDERVEAQAVAQQYQTHHHELLVKPEVQRVLPSVVAAFDQPQGDSSAIPNYYIAQAARSHVTVALSGMGGDEMAGGYERYLGVLVGQCFSALPRAFRRILERSGGLFPDVGGKGRFSAARLKRFLRSTQLDPREAYLSLLSTFSVPELEQVLAGRWKRQVRGSSAADLLVESFGPDAPIDLTNKMLHADVNGYLPGDLLPLSDRMSMAHSLELRVPFLDHQLLEFAASIPVELKIRRLTKKYVLRAIGEKLLPAAILRKQKRGFSIPLAFWLRGDLRPFVESELASQRVAEMGYFDAGNVAKLLKEHFSGRANHENKIWALIVFNLWHRMYIESASTVTGTGAEVKAN